MAGPAAGLVPAENDPKPDIHERLCSSCLHEPKQDWQGLAPTHAEEFGRACGIYRLAEVIALAMLAPGRDEKLYLSFGLDALSNDFNAKFVGQSNCGPHDRRAPGFGG